jgi:sulfide:quinone oxidoreductase
VTRRSTRVVIAGAGVAGLEALLALRAVAGPLVQLDMLSADPTFRYRPVSVAEAFDRGRAPEFDLEEICADQGARLHRDTLTVVDSLRRRVLTRGGAELPYDLLAVAIGARPVEVLPGALTFRGFEDVGALREVLAGIADGGLENVVFALPPNPDWPLPLYELALMTGAHAQACGASTRVRVVTAEAEPLGLFGAQASGAVARLLRARAVEVTTLTRPVAVEDHTLHIDGARSIPADRVIALPRLAGPQVAGLPHDASGFIPTDLHGLVKGRHDVYAAGDATAFPVKQGGLASQQADAVAEALAQRAGAPVTPRPFHAVVRGLLLTGSAPAYLRTERRVDSAVSDDPLWWPPTRIVGRYLAPYLAMRSLEGSQSRVATAPPRGAARA